MLGTSTEKKEVLLPFADVSTWPFNMNLRARKTSVVEEEVREVKKVSSHLSFKMQRKKMLRNVTTLRCGALLETIPATLSVLSEEQSPDRTMGNSTDTHRHVNRDDGLLAMSRHLRTGGIIRIPEDLRERVTLLRCGSWWRIPRRGYVAGNHPERYDHLYLSQQIVSPRFWQLRSSLLSFLFKCPDVFHLSFCH